MKRIFLCIVALLFLCSCTVPSSTPSGGQTGEILEEDAETSAETSEGLEYVPTTPSNFKGVWLSQWDMQRVYVKGGKQRDKTDFVIRATSIMTNAREDGFNTVFVQVRPFGDSFYPSELYPPSKMVVGTYGAGFDYDPFEILVDAAHNAGLSVHAWINPLRLMTTEELELVPQTFKVRMWYDDPALRGSYLVLQGDGRWYLNPGYSEVRDLIVDGAREIVRRYEVDGVHMDDYFYPTTAESYDAQCFAQYSAGGGELKLADFRRNAVSLLVKDLWLAVHEISPKALFGIAPGGNPDRAYTSQYADVFLWCSQTGYVDYICPEIYFGFEHETYPFDKTAERWAKMVTCDEVKLIIGLSFHKASSGFDQYAGSGAYEWAQNSDILLRSLECSAKLARCSGVSVFSYQYFRNALTGEVPDYPADERNAFLPLFRQVVFPASDIPF